MEDEKGRKGGREERGQEKKGGEKEGWGEKLAYYRQSEQENMQFHVALCGISSERDVCFHTHTHTQVSQAAEDLFTLLAPALPTESAIELLSPMVAQEKYPMLLGTIKLLTKVKTGTT